MAGSDLHDVYVRISREGDEYVALAKFFSVAGEARADGVRHSFQFTAAEPPHRIVSLPPGLGQFIVGYIGDALATGVIPPFSEPPRILLDVEPPELFKVDWEELGRLPFPSHVVTRFRMVSDERVLQAFELPMRVLMVRPSDGATTARPADWAMRYFRVHEISGIGNAELIQTVRRGHFDIVHLLADIWLQENGMPVLSVTSDTSSDEEDVDVPTLRRMLNSCRARFLVLHGRPSNTDPYVAALHMAHRLQQAGGPTTLVLNEATEPFLSNLYMAVVHNAGPQSILSDRAGAANAAMFHGIGGERVLQIRPLAERLDREVQRSIAAGNSLLENLRVRGADVRAESEGIPIEARSAAGSFVDALAAQVGVHVQSERRVYDYTRESGAWIPLQAERRAHSRRVDEIGRLQRAIGRVVNVGLIDGDHKLESDEVLVARRSYKLSVQIGRRAGWSMVDRTAALPERALAREYVSGGTQLRVVVFAEPFEVDRPDRLLRLEPPPKESRELSFALKAPRAAGRYRLRVCLYHKLNLLQSILVRVTVSSAAKPKRKAQANRAEVEFALSSSLSSLDDLKPRRLNFLINESDDGTHTMKVVGTRFRSSFDFGDSEMRSAVDEARQALYEIAADTKDKNPVYRFDANNSTTVERLEQDTVRLAQLGYALYWKLIVAKKRSFAQELSSVLTPAGVPIQIASVKSARYVFPWSLVYDQRLVTGNLKLCPQFAADARANVPVATRVCLKTRCPHHDNPKIVCPSGFWGYRHLIEQPLSTSAKPEDVDPGDVVTKIDGGRVGSDVSGLMVVSRELPQVNDHEDELKGRNSFAFRVRDNKVTVGESLADPASAAHLVYFYCHGGRHKSRTWLGIGKNERLDVTDLRGLQIDWTGVHPLVFINGCHTADFTPDDLINFNEAFAYCRAAGVIGTEISVPEELARDFARGFLRSFRAGKPVGEALREQRFALLERRNLLGLAYTPYCLSALHVVQQ